MTKNIFGEKVKRTRESKGMSQTALANKAGLDKSQINKIESGTHRRPHANTKKKIADALETTVQFLEDETLLEDYYFDLRKLPDDLFGKISKLLSEQKTKKVSDIMEEVVRSWAANREE